MREKSPNSILIIDNDRESNKNIAFFLEDRFNTVISAFDGQEGWKYYNEYAPDIIITDIEMPKMDGLALIQKIRKNDPDTTIIVLTAHSHQQYLMRAVTLKLDEYLIKPIMYSKLNDTLHRIRQKKNYHTGKITFDEYENAYYSYESKTIFFQNKEISLTNKEIMMFELLIENRGKVIEYDYIEERLYSNSSKTHNPIKCIIRDLRKKLPFIHIVSVAKWGYKLL